MSLCSRSGRFGLTFVSFPIMNLLSKALWLSKYALIAMLLLLSWLAAVLALFNLLLTWETLLGLLPSLTDELASLPMWAANSYYFFDWLFPFDSRFRLFNSDELMQAVLYLLLALIVPIWSISRASQQSLGSRVARHIALNIAFGALILFPSPIQISTSEVVTRYVQIVGYCLLLLAHVALALNFSLRKLRFVPYRQQLWRQSWCIFHEADR